MKMALSNAPADSADLAANLASTVTLVTDAAPDSLDLVRAGSPSGRPGSGDPLDLAG